jgi:hypothetical protein
MAISMAAAALHNVTENAAFMHIPRITEKKRRCTVPPGKVPAAVHAS